MKMKGFLFFLLIWPSILGAIGVEGKEKEEESEFLFAGSLLSYPSETLAPGDYSIQSTFIMVQSSHDYNSHGDLVPSPNTHLYPFFFNIQMGLAKNIDAQVTFQTTYNYIDGHGKTLLGDTVALLGFQLLEEKSQKIDFKIFVGESFPTGKYNDLHPDLYGIDISSSGSFETIIIFSANKLFFPKSHHPLNFTANLDFIFPSPVLVKNFNAYGGGRGTKGKVMVGNEVIFNLAFQYAITKHCAFDIDLNYAYQGPSHFYRSKESTGPDAERAAAFVLSTTPGIEYAFNENIGILVGGWFSIMGANMFAFSNAYTSFYYYF